MGASANLFFNERVPILEGEKTFDILLFTLIPTELLIDFLYFTDSKTNDNIDIS